MIEAFHRDTVKYALGILILLAFIAILGVYLIFLGRFTLVGNGNGAGVLLANQGNNDTNQRLLLLQAEIEETLARVRELEAAKQPAPVAPTTPRPVTPSPAPVVAPFLKISRFEASQTSVSSGTQVDLYYDAVNTSRGKSFMLLLQCPASVTAVYSNGANVCRRTISEALPIDNSGIYSVNLRNTGSAPETIIAVLLARDNDNTLNFRDSRVITVTVNPSNSYNYSNNYIYNYSNSDASIALTSNPNSAPAPASISFTATLNNLTSCVQSHWEFGDGITSENFSICPNSFSSLYSRVLYQTHQYSQSGTYTATLYAGNMRASNTIYVSSRITPTYYYNPPVYNYTYNQPPVYNYNYPSLPDVPTTPRNFRATASNNNGITLSWSLPAYGNVVNYTIYRRGGNSLDIPVGSSLSPCSINTTSTCYFTVSGNSTSFTDGNVLSGNNYTYRIVAGNSYGSSDFSESLTVGLAESNTPGVPRTFTATTNGARIVLNWTAPASGNISGYTIYRKGGSSLPIPVNFSPRYCNNTDIDLCYYFVGGQTFNFTDYNLLPNTAYTYRIVASNSYGTSDYSEGLTIVSGQSDVSVATPTLNLISRSDTLGLTQLSWNSVGASYYRIYRSTTHNDILPASDDNLSSCTSNITGPCFITISGESRIFSLQVIDNQYDSTRTYFYRVRAYNGSSVSSWSNEVRSEPNVIVPPSTPDPVITSYTVDGQASPTVSSGSLLAISYSGNNVLSYKLFVQCPAGVSVSDPNTGGNLCRTSQGDAVALNGSGSFQMSAYNLNTTNQTFSVTLIALRANGTVGNSLTRSVTVRGTTPVLTRTSAPQNLRATSNTASISLSWDAPLSGTPSNYVVLRKIGIFSTYQPIGVLACSANNVDPCIISTVSQSVTDNNAISGTPYTYVVYASNSAGLSDPSNDVFSSFVSTSPSPTPLPPPPPPAPAPDPVIISYTVNVQTSPVVSSGSLINIAYSGTNVASYKLFLQCSANVMIPDPATGGSLCRTNQGDAVSISGSGSYQFAIYNLNNGDRVVTATLLALRANGTLSNSLTRNITVHAQ